MIQTLRQSLMGVPSDPPARRILTVLVAASFLVHLAWFALDKKHDDPDTHSYIVPAMHLLAGDGFLDEQGFPNTFRTPGYPLVIAAFLSTGLGLTGLILLQHVLAAVLVAALFTFTLSATGDLLIATVAGAISILYFPNLEEANLIMAETLFTVVLYVVFVMTYRLSQNTRHPILLAAAIGLLAGLNVLLRPIGLYFVLVLAAYSALFASRRRLLVVAVILLTFALPPAIWTMRNHRRTGIATVSSITGENLLFFRAAGLMVIEDQSLLYGLFAMQLEHDFFLRFRRLQPKLKRAAEARAESALRMPAESLSHVQKEIYYKELGGELVRSRILHYPKLFVSGVIQLLIDGLWQVPVNKLHFDYRRAIPGFTLIGFALMTTAAAGVAFLIRTEAPLGWLIALTLAYFVVLSAGPGGVYRFSVPIAPMYALAAAGGIRWLGERTGLLRDLQQLVSIFRQS